MSRLLILVQVFVLLIICGCGNKSAYESALSELLDKDGKIQVLAQPDSGGVIYIQDEKKRKAYKDLDNAFKEMVNSGEIVPLLEHKVSDFRKSADTLKGLEESNISIYVQAKFAYVGISDGGTIYVAKGDEAKAKEITNQ